MNGTSFLQYFVDSFHGQEEICGQFIEGAGGGVVTADDDVLNSGKRLG